MGNQACIHEIPTDRCASCSALQDMRPEARRYPRLESGKTPQYRAGVTRRGPTGKAKYPGRCPRCGGGLAVGLFVGRDLKLGRSVCYRCYMRLP